MTRRGLRAKAEETGLNYRKMFVPRNEAGDVAWPNRYAAHAAGAAAMGGLISMGIEINLREQEKEVIHMQLEMARQWSGDDPPEET